jgi:hypothetical protein
MAKLRLAFIENLLMSVLAHSYLNPQSTVDLGHAIHS